MLVVGQVKKKTTTLLWIPTRPLVIFNSRQIADYNQFADRFFNFDFKIRRSERDVVFKLHAKNFCWIVSTPIPPNKWRAKLLHYSRSGVNQGHVPWIIILLAKFAGTQVRWIRLDGRRHHHNVKGVLVAQWLGRRTFDQAVAGSIPGRGLLKSPRST